MQVWMWLVAASGLLVAEMLTVDLIFASLAFSALMAAITNALGFDMVAQGVVFGAAAGFSLFVLRPIALKHLKKRPADFATNIEALIGAPAIALTQITDRAGQVKLSGEIWTARSESGLIESDKWVEVVAIEGATALVKEKDK